jgi:hypothetical protein
MKVISYVPDDIGFTPRISPAPRVARVLADRLLRHHLSEGDLSRRPLVEPLTRPRCLRLLPISSYLQIAASWYISGNTVKTYRRSIHQKLDVTSRSQAVERAMFLRLL